MEGHMLKESIFTGSFLEYSARDRIVANQSEMKINLKVKPVQCLLPIVDNLTANLFFICDRQPLRNKWNPSLFSVT